MYFYLVFSPESSEVICENAASTIIMLSHPQPERAGPRAAWEELSALSREPSLLSTGCGRSSWGHLRGVGGAGWLATPGKGVQKLGLRPTRDTLGHGDVEPPQAVALRMSVLTTQPGPGLARDVWDRRGPQKVRTSGLPWGSSG